MALAAVTRDKGNEAETARDALSRTIATKLRLVGEWCRGDPQPNLPQEKIDQSNNDRHNDNHGQ